MSEIDTSKASLSGFQFLDQDEPECEACEAQDCKMILWWNVLKCLLVLFLGFPSISLQAIAIRFGAVAPNWGLYTF